MRLFQRPDVQLEFSFVPQQQVAEEENGRGKYSGPLLTWLQLQTMSGQSSFPVCSQQPSFNGVLIGLHGVGIYYS